MDNSVITILNVDGSEVELYAKSRILWEAGYSVIEARTGAEALRLASASAPQLILLSADLPDWNGFEALRRIKSDITLSSQAAPPLILLLSSTFVGCEKRARALEEGADGYLLEPAMPEFLLANIKMLLRQCLDAGEIARALAEERRRNRALEGLARLALVINSADTLDEILQVVAQEAREIIGAHQAAASLNPDALDSNDPAAGAMSLSRKHAQEPVDLCEVGRETWFSSLVCRLNRPMRLTQAELECGLRYSTGSGSDRSVVEPVATAPGTVPELEWRLDWQKAHETYETRRHPHALEGVVTPLEFATLRRMASLREFAGLHEVATPREIACLRELEAARKPQILRGLDMRGWLAAPLSSRDGAYGRNLGLIQLSDKYDGEFTEQDEAELAQIALMVSIAVENRLCWRREQKLREAAENAARAKDEFIAMTSHRLRAQLNTLLGWSWVLRRQADNMEDVTRAAEIIERAARTQAGIVEDLLGASRKGAVKRKERETEGWGDEETEGQGDFSWNPSVPLSLYSAVPQSPSSVHYSPNPTSRGVAAGGGC
ncbi:MAG TPA: response regulator [Blastocatellia bacterium]|nr:response regulator [Blastocatellia bacterium]